MLFRRLTTDLQLKDIASIVLFGGAKNMDPDHAMKSFSCRTTGGLCIRTKTKDDIRRHNEKQRQVVNLAPLITPAGWHHPLLRHHLLHECQRGLASIPDSSGSPLKTKLRCQTVNASADDHWTPGLRDPDFVKERPRPDNWLPSGCFMKSPGPPPDNPRPFQTEGWPIQLYKPHVEPHDSP